MKPTPEQIAEVRAATKRTVMLWGGHGVVYIRPNGIDGTYVDSADARRYKIGCCDEVVAVYRPDGSCVEGRDAMMLALELGPRDLGDAPERPEPRYDPLDCNYH